MALGEINLRQKSHGGSGGKGSFWGGLAGALIGGIATVASAGSAAPAVPALVGAGMGIGGAVGNAVDPAKVETTKKISKLESTVKTDPGAQLAALQNARLKLADSTDIPQPEADAYMAHINAGMGELKKRMAISRGENIG